MSHFTSYSQKRFIQVLKNRIFYGPVFCLLTLRKARGASCPPPLEDYRKILKVGAPKTRQLLFQLLKYSFTHFSANSNPAGATAGHRLVAGHSQVAVGQPILKFERCSKCHENWYSGHFLGEKHDGTIHFL